MKKVFLLIIFAAFIGVNTIYFSNKKNDDIILNGLFRVAVADEESGNGTCYTQTTYSTYFFQCVGGGEWRYEHYSLTCIAGTFYSCTEGWSTCVTECDGEKDYSSYNNYVPC